VAVEVGAPPQTPQRGEVGALPQTPPKPFLKERFWNPKNFNKKKEKSFFQVF
jgi:hypothetical protein